MRENYTLPRLYLDMPLSVGAALPLDKARAHYIGTVLRKAVGDSVRVFNGRDGEWRAEVTDVDKKRGTLTVVEPLRRPHAVPDIWLCFAPVRKHRNAFIFEKGTELGVSAFHPVVTERTQFPKMSVEKSAAQIIEAAEQTERLDIPAVAPTTRLADMIAAWDPARRLIFADEAGGGVSAVDAVGACPPPAAILIGPEGGFTDQERDLLKAQNFVTTITLGPRILRADTAALSLLTLWQATSGDW